MQANEFKITTILETHLKSFWAGRHYTKTISAVKTSRRKLAENPGANAVQQGGFRSFPQIIPSEKGANRHEQTETSKQKRTNRNEQQKHQVSRIFSTVPINRSTGRHAETGSSGANQPVSTLRFMGLCVCPVALGSSPNIRETSGGYSTASPLR